MVNAVTTVMDASCGRHTDRFVYWIVGNNNDLTGSQDLGICVSIRTLRMAANAVWSKQMRR
ncbi:hypothetical protein PHMEG_00016733 [Phytophthora megakarya]|uniref:Uncharacterized protein n=1 Tax=Phytophthora megakarya TaxID=4795 RepID=A0A225VYI0_9STRA|nr:hypothetical protein PHMEG_00016733 [Phytophthora megakarya]